MKQIFFIILYLTGSIILYAQNDSIAIVADSFLQPNEESTKQIIIQDSTKVEAVALPPDYQKQYLDNKDFNYEQIETRNIGAELQDWLINLLMKIFKITQRDKASELVDNLLVVVYIIIFGLVIWFIIRAILRKEGRWIFRKSPQQLNNDDLNSSIAIEETDIESLIAKYQQENNYRMAIRYYFVWLLKNLGERNIIQVEQDKTASQYAYEINNDSLRKDYLYATYLYNYIWFGEFEVNREEYEHASANIKKVINNA